jgi:hypothetical protein
MNQRAAGAANELAAGDDRSGAEEKYALNRI